MPAVALTPLGYAVPLGEQHAISVSLPAWEDCVGYEKNEDRVVKAMQIGYPRFFVHKSIQKLAAYCIDRFGSADETCYLYPSEAIARTCQVFLNNKTPSVACRIHRVDLIGPPEHTNDSPEDKTPVTSVFAVMIKSQNDAAGKEFWQHTGDGISSRYADRCLFLLSRSAFSSPITSPKVGQANALGQSRNSKIFGRNRHYAKASSWEALDALDHSTSSTPSVNGSVGSTPTLGEDQEVEDVARSYVEERYGRNLAGTLGPLAKVALRRRIAGVLRDQPLSSRASGSFNASRPLQCLSLDEEQESLEQSGGRNANKEDSSRGVAELDEDDVYLYPTGMSAIFNAHQLLLSNCERVGRPAGKSVCFGFPYTDTLKILQKWGPGCIHYGNGTNADLDEFERFLDAHGKTDEPPLLSVFTEYPSNPLLRCADLKRLRRLADQYNFAIVIDETIGTFANVEVLPWADITVSSLTKIFSGDANVMGGSMVLNPSKSSYKELKLTQDRLYSDNFFEEDAIFLERNSRDFMSRVECVDRNAALVCDMLQAHFESTSNKTVTGVYYPKFTTPELYRACLRTKSERMPTEPGYGCLFSVTFKDLVASEAFYDALACQKGPSLGTNFTLACPYTVLAHWNEILWAEEWGVPLTLVRVAVGLEHGQTLLSWFQAALLAAEATST